MEWEDRFPNYHLQCLSTDASDHAPLLLRTNTQLSARRRFCFEAFWPRLPGYMETVTAAWQTSITGADHIRIMDCKLRATARALQSCSQKHIGSVRLQLAIAREVVHRLEAAQERW